MPEDQQGCARCGGQRLLPARPVGDGGRGASRTLYSVVAENDPDALVDTEPVVATLRVRICCDCGVAELVLADPSPEQLWTAWGNAVSTSREARSGPGR